VDSGQFVLDSTKTAFTSFVPFRGGTEEGEENSFGFFKCRRLLRLSQSDDPNVGISASDLLH
jgi:hypothetical protein